MRNNVWQHLRPCCRPVFTLSHRADTLQPRLKQSDLTHTNPVNNHCHTQTNGDTLSLTFKTNININFLIRVTHIYAQIVLVISMNISSQICTPTLMHSYLFIKMKVQT